MGSIIIFAIVALWLIVMLPAIAAPFLLDRSKTSANVTPKPTTIPLRAQSGRAKNADTPSHRSAA